MWLDHYIKLVMMKTKEYRVGATSNKSPQTAFTSQVHAPNTSAKCNRKHFSGIREKMHNKSTLKYI